MHGAAIWKCVSASGSWLDAPLRCCGRRIAANRCHYDIALKTIRLLYAGMLKAKRWQVSLLPEEPTNNNESWLPLVWR